MKKHLNFVLLLALGAGTLATSASAQQAQQFNDRDNAQLEYGVASSSQNGQLRLADWDDHRRCDGDHDRDDRGCSYQDPYGNRYYRGNVYYGNGYYGQRSNGYYDRKGNFYPNGANGYFDEHGNWHYFKGRRDWDDR
ncbi:MAG: hypothetical protein P4M04_14275 [Acidobacteriota bacterium]|nr:hypothetical protein [Acidobacteriota bacterium]